MNAELAARQQEEEARDKDEKEERDDPEELARKRQWDDWKDDHRRGEGNRKNMG
jgi:immunoglobulin-binding protein 1